MRKKIMGILLTLLSATLAIGPIFVAFNSNNWNLKETVMPQEGEIDEIKNRIESVLPDDFTEDAFFVKETSVDGSQLSITVEFTSPISNPITIEEFDLDIRDERDFLLGEIELKDETKVPEKGKATIYFSGSLTGKGEEIIQKSYGGNIPSNTSFSDGSLKVRTSGITVTVDLGKILNSNDFVRKRESSTGEGEHEGR